MGNSNLKFFYTLLKLIYVLVNEYHNTQKNILDFEGSGLFSEWQFWFVLEKYVWSRWMYQFLKTVFCFVGYGSGWSIL